MNASTKLGKMYDACSDPLILASQLATARELPAADVLQRRISTVFEKMASKCREAGFDDQDVTDARYAIAALMDEQVFRSSWSGRQQWMSQPLQLVYFNENTAGEGFFTRMQALFNDNARAHVLQIYYLCLALGFQGKFAIRGGEGLGAFVDHAVQQLARAAGNTELSPRGEPRDSARGLIQREMPIVAISVICFVLAIGLYVVLKVSLGSSVSSATTEMTKGLPAAPSAAQAPKP